MKIYTSLLSVAVLLLVGPISTDEALFQEGWLDTTFGNKDAPIVICLCGAESSDCLTALEFERLTAEGVLGVSWIEGADQEGATEGIVYGEA
jgi:hypothetical protein